MAAFADTNRNASTHQVGQLCCGSASFKTEVSHRSVRYDTTRPHLSNGQMLRRRQARLTQSSDPCHGFVVKKCVPWHDDLEPSNSTMELRRR